MREALCRPVPMPLRAVPAGHRSTGPRSRSLPAPGGPQRWPPCTPSRSASASWALSPAGGCGPSILTGDSAPTEPLTPRLCLPCPPSGFNYSPTCGFPAPCEVPRLVSLPPSPGRACTGPGGARHPNLHLPVCPGPTMAHLTAFYETLRLAPRPHQPPAPDRGPHPHAAKGTWRL